jgi:class 3 adenylate cyclase/tetratricopeptide (TPR) repeat protein
LAASLAGYLPAMLLRRLAAGPIEAPEARRAPCAILLSDIQGFSRLVERLSARGRAGLEELTWRLNGYFADVVEVIDAHGGDVLYITGDAFYCVWPAGDGPSLADAVARAAQAGLAVQARVDQRPAGDGQRFATRIGVGAGELLTAYAGGLEGRWELIATGEALADVVAAEREAPAGTVRLSPSAWALVADRCDGRSLAGGGAELLRVRRAPPAAPPTPAPADLGPAVRPFLPPAVLDREQVADQAWLAEFRTVSVVLADLPPLRDTEGASLAQLHAGVRAVQEVGRRYEGTVRVDVDEKGILLLAVFGLPPRAHEDDALRGVQAGRALADGLRALGLAAGVGVATGRALCGVFGSERRRDYMLRGDVINLAARLMSAAKGDIACDAATVQGVRGRMAFEALAPIAVKGRERPVPVFRPQGRAEARTAATHAIVGREAERARLAGALAALQSGAGATVLIEADAGLGKSALAGELAARARAAGVQVLVAPSDAIERSTPYFAWRPVAAALLDLTPELDPAAARARVDQRMRGFPELEPLVPLLSAVLPVPIPDTALTAEMTGEVRADNTRRLLAELLRSAATSRPTLLVVEDAHWLDSSSWALLLDVLRGVRPILAVVTTRVSGAEPGVEHAALRQLAGPDRLRLEGLAPEETADLLRRRLGCEELPVTLARVVQDRSAGNPFFAEELLEALREAGVVRVADGRAVVGDLERVDLPGTVEGVILSRLDRLESGQQLCLKVASVIGRVFRARTLRETHPVAEERGRVPAHLAALTRLELTLPESPEPDLAYLFKHVVTRDVTYELMPLAQRQPLHRGVAEWYERHHAADLAPHYALLSYHWARAGDPGRTAGYLELAGEQALRDGAFQEALVFFGQALALAHGGRLPADPVRDAHWSRGLGVAHYFLGDLPASRRFLEQAVAALDRPIPSGRAVGGALLAAAGTQALHRLRPHRWLGRRREERRRLVAAADCYRILGQIYYLDGEPAEGLTYPTVRGLNVAEEAGPSPELARLLQNIAVVAGLLGRRRWADWYADQAVRMAEQEGQYAAGAYVWHIRAIGEAQVARWAAARAANDAALERIRKLGDYNLEAEAWVVRATITLCQGDYLAAPEAWSQARRLAERSGNAQIVCWSLLDEVETLLGRDDVAGADRVLETALAIPVSETDGSSILEKHRALALTRLRQGRAGEALAAADAVVEFITRHPPTGYHWADFCASAAEVHAELVAASAAGSEERRVLTRKATRSCRLLRRLGRQFHNVRPRARLIAGTLAWAGGRRSAARRQWAEAARLAERMEMPFERAKALVAQARVAPAGGRADIAEAVAIFERLGAWYEARRARAVSDGPTRPA